MDPAVGGLAGRGDSDVDVTGRHHHPSGGGDGRARDVFLGQHVVGCRCRDPAQRVTRECAPGGPSRRRGRGRAESPSGQKGCVVGAGEGEAGPACTGPVMGSVESSTAQAGGRAVEADGAGTVTCLPKAWRSSLEYRVRECNRTFALPSISACRRQKAASMPPSVSSRKSALRCSRWPNSRSNSRNTACTRLSGLP